MQCTPQLAGGSDQIPVCEGGREWAIPLADELAHETAGADGGSLSGVRHGIDGSTALIGQQLFLGLVPCAVFATMSHPIVLFFDEPKVNPIGIRVRDRPDAHWPVLAGAAAHGAANAAVSIAAALATRSRDSQMKASP